MIGRLNALQGAKIFIAREKETHLQTCLQREYVSFQEGKYFHLDRGLNANSVHFQRLGSFWGSIQW